MMMGGWTCGRERAGERASESGCKREREKACAGTRTMGIAEGPALKKGSDVAAVHLVAHVIPLRPVDLAALLDVCVDGVDDLGADAIRIPEEGKGGGMGEGGDWWGRV